MGKILWVNLSMGGIEDEKLKESLYQDFIGGYGIGARLLYSRQMAGIDPMVPDNTLGLITGLLTGAPVGERRPMQTVSNLIINLAVNCCKL